MTTIAPQSAASRLEMPATDHRPRPYTGPSREDVLAMRRQYMNPAVFTIYREPILAHCLTDDDVVRQVRITVVHEIGHHFGLDDRRLRELGYG